MMHMDDHGTLRTIWQPKVETLADAEHSVHVALSAARRIGGTNLRSDQSDIMKEAASAGLDPKIIRQVMRLRSMDGDKRDEADHMLALYRRAVGV